MPEFTRKIRFTLAGALTVPCIAYLNLLGTGAAYDVYRYIAPLMVGAVAGFLIGSITDRWHTLNQNLASAVDEKTADLKAEIDRRLKSETALEQAREELEKRVARRTAEIAAANEALRLEVAERRRSEAALSQSEKRYRSLIDQAADAIYVVDMDGRILDVNETACRSLGYLRRDLLQLNVADIDPLAVEDEHKRRLWDQLDIGQHLCVQGRHRRKDGGTFPVEVRIGLFNANVYSRDEGSIKIPAGKIMISIARDITERKEVERTLRESEEYHRRLFEDSPIALFLQDFSAVADQVTKLESVAARDVKTYLQNHPQEVDRLARSVKVYRANQAAVDLYRAASASEFMKSMHQVLLSEDRQHFIDQVVAFAAGQDWFEGKARNRTFAGEVIDLIIRKTVINRKANGLSMVLVSLTDVTELHRAHREKERLEASLMQSRKMEAIGTLAGGIAHDFNNLLMGIQGRTSLLLSDMHGQPEYTEHLKGIEAHVKDAADLTRQLLGFAKGGKFEVLPTDINTLVEQQNRLFARTKKEIRLCSKCAPDLWGVAVDRGQIKQVLMNLYVNAWQAMPAGGDLYVQTRNVFLDEQAVKPFGLKPGKFVQISVTDTGTGMDKAIRQQVFDPFFTTKEKSRGTGLGLASAWGIIRNHGGYISVYSEKGQGTTFNVYLPISDKAIRADRQSVRETRRGSGTVLLVDDEKMILHVGRRMLERLGYDVLEAPGGRQALDLYARAWKTIDLVVLDMIMPDLGGSEVYDGLKKINPQAKVILSSGYSINGRAAEILERGCNGFIQKPFDLSTLSMKIENVLGPKTELPAAEGRRQ